MKISIHGSNMPITDNVEQYVEKKIGKLDRYLPHIIEARVDLRKENTRKKNQSSAQLTIRTSGGDVLRAEDKNQKDLFTAVDAVVDKMYRQITRLKGKKQRKGGEKWIEAAPEWAQMEEVPLDDDFVEDYDNEPSYEIIRRKEVLITPMSEEEAIDQMELLGHDFFLFFNGKTSTINVLYRRKDGHYGVLVPQID